MIIVVSDVHLGYDKSDKDNFSNFIDSELTKLKANDHLVLLGDILDFWRKNCVDATVEHEKDSSIDDITPTEGGIMKKLFDLTKKTQVHYVVGNHDYSVLYFSKRVDNFPFPIFRNLHLSVQGTDKKFYFIHGYEFEVLAKFAFMTIEGYEKICQHLCDVRETNVGRLESAIWSALHLFRFPIRKDGEHVPATEYVPEQVVKSIKDEHRITEPPEQRMKELHPPSQDRMKPLLKPRDEIEELAMSPVSRSMLIGGGPDETIIFGHTHSPFFTQDKMVANSGSWVTDNDFHDTYITIDNHGDVNLRQYIHNDQH
jgi:UDP-2,3-diacylglucosamine pyrophosphatase LpxH